MDPLCSVQGLGELKKIHLHPTYFTLIYPCVLYKSSRTCNAHKHFHSTCFRRGLLPCYFLQGSLQVCPIFADTDIPYPFVRAVVTKTKFLYNFKRNRKPSFDCFCTLEGQKRSYQAFVSVALKLYAHAASNFLN